MPYIVYIMECTDGSLYTGITTDLKRRFGQHRDKKGGAYTSAHRVERLVYAESLPTRSAALRREAEIKSWRRAKKLELVNGASGARLARRPLKVRAGPPGGL